MATRESEQIERINSEVSAQAALISQISAALDGKGVGGGGGSGGVGTCTIQVNLPVEQGIFLARIATTSSGVYYNGENYSDNFTIENVLCGSAVCLVYNKTYSSVVTTENAELVDINLNGTLQMVGTAIITVKAPTEAGVIGIVNIKDAD